MFIWRWKQKRLKIRCHLLKSVDLWPTSGSFIYQLAIPDLPVMYSGGVLQIQSHSLSTQTFFQLAQSAALLTAVCLQDGMYCSKTTAPNWEEDTVMTAVQSTQSVTLLFEQHTSSWEVSRWIFFTLQDGVSSNSQNRRKLYNCSGGNEESVQNNFILKHSLHMNKKIQCFVYSKMF